MKSLAGLLLAVFVVGIAHARQNNQGLGGASTVTGAQDQQCWGGTPSGLSSAPGEVCVNSLGNIEPTTAGSLTVGSTSYPFVAVNVSTLNSGGAALNIPVGGGNSLTEGTAGVINTAGSTTNINGTAASNFGVSGLINVQSVVIGTANVTGGIVISTTIPVLSSYETILSSGGNITLTSTPNIATTTILGALQKQIPDGTFLTLVSTGAAYITLQSSGTLTNSGVRLSSATVQLRQGSAIQFIFNSALGIWLQTALTQ